MKKIKYEVQMLNGRAWARLGSTRAPGIAPIHEVLRFVVEQINLGNVDCTCDESGMVTDMVIGAVTATGMGRHRIFQSGPITPTDQRASSTAKGKLGRPSRCSLMSHSTEWQPTL